MLEQWGTTITIAATLESVHDATCTLDWFGPELAVSKLSGKQRPGGVYELRMHALRGRATRPRSRSLRRPPPRRVPKRRLQGVHVQRNTCLEPVAAGTHVTLHMRAQPHGRYRFMKPVIAPLMHHSMTEMLSRLKAHVEQRLAAAA